MSEINNKQPKKALTPRDTNILTFGLFSLTGIIYFLTAGYSYLYVKNYEGTEITTNIALGVMFICIGLSFWQQQPKK
jgi:hypothetical protein